MKTQYNVSTLIEQSFAQVDQGSEFTSNGNVAFKDYKVFTTP